MIEFKNAELKAWVEEYCRQRLEECRNAKTTTEALKREWRTWSEGEWAAWRELLPLRAQVRLRGLEAEARAAIARKVTVSYSRGLEVAALKELLGVGRPLEKPVRPKGEQLSFDEPRHHQQEH